MGAPKVCVATARSREPASSIEADRCHELLDARGRGLSGAGTTAGLVFSATAATVAVAGHNVVGRVRKR